MTVARVAQDEVDAVRREMQEKVKAAQEVADRQVSTKCILMSLQHSTQQVRHVYSSQGFAVK